MENLITRYFDLAEWWSNMWCDALGSTGMIIVAVINTVVMGIIGVLGVFSIVDECITKSEK